MHRKEKTPVFIGLGSNIGDRLSYLKQAVSEVAGEESNEIEKISPVYETKPLGPAGQGKYLNAVMKIYTEFEPEPLLHYLKSIETYLGRKERIRWSSREIDLDILFYGDLICRGELLTIPHPGIAERDFVLKPLCDIEPDLLHPALMVKISDICKQTNESFIINDRYAEISVRGGRVAVNGK